MYGMSDHNLDSKGRLCMPTRLLTELGPKFYITINGCVDNDGVERPFLTVYPEKEWQIVQENLAECEDDDELQNEAGMLFAYTSDCILDPSGRVTLTAAQREYANITKSVVVNGNNRTADIWDADTWLAHQKTLLRPGQVRRIVARGRSKRLPE